MEIRLEITCSGCPEQYDAYDGETKVGDLRLRNGRFIVMCGSETVLKADTRGDGIFTPDERDGFLEQAKEAIRKHYGYEPPEDPQPQASPMI